jgi:glycosyltransferase involved in cell wall biosynthesis
MDKGRRFPAVLHLIDSLAVGGAERVAVELANAQAAEGYEVHLCTTRRDGALESLLAPAVGRLRLCRTTRLSPGAVARLARYVRAHSIDVLHAHSTSLFVAAQARFLCPRVRLVWHDHYGRSEERGSRSALPFKLAARWIDGAVAVTAELANWAIAQVGVPEEREWYIPNGIPLHNGAAPIPLPGPAGARIACVANLRRQKDHLTLVQSIALLRNEVGNASLLLVGTGSDRPYEAEVRAEVARLGLNDAVFFLGERGDVPAVLASCDVGVLASRSEGLPLALLEYGVAGLAAVATAVGQCEEVLDGGEAGLLVPAGDADSLAGALSSLLRDPVRRAELGRRLRARVGERYAVGRVVRDLRHVYRTVLADRHHEWKS